MKSAKHGQLLKHLQTAIEIELATIPVYLYTYYSINRLPSDCDDLKNSEDILNFANRSGGLIMSVAVEEMLHMSLACNILKALGGKPQLYLKSPEPFPSNLPHHKKGFSVGLEKLSTAQMSKFLMIEKPEKPGAPPEGDKWETIGQFYDWIENYIVKNTTDKDFKHTANQLKTGDGYYAANNIDTIYPTDASYVKKPIEPQDPAKRGASQANYPNAADSGHLVKVHDKASAIEAIRIIKHQGEGYPDDKSHKYDDPKKNEDSHWYKFNQLHKKMRKLSKDSSQVDCFVYDFPTNPTLANYEAKYQPLVRVTNAVYSYLLLITQVSFELKGPAQFTMFYIGMHKGMIFILDKIIGAMRSYALSNKKNGSVLAPTFENYQFVNIENAKKELVDLAESLPPALALEPQILQRIKDLPDVNVPASGVVQFA